MYVTDKLACTVQNSAMQPPAASVARAQAAYVKRMTDMDSAQKGFDSNVYCRAPQQFASLGTQIAADVAHTPAGGSVGISAGIPAAVVASGAPGTGAAGDNGGKPGRACGCEIAGANYYPATGQSVTLPLPPAAVLTTTQGPRVPQGRPISHQSGAGLPIEQQLRATTYQALPGFTPAPVPAGSQRVLLPGGYAPVTVLASQVNTGDVATVARPFLPIQGQEGAVPWRLNPAPAALPPARGWQPGLSPKSKSGFSGFGDYVCSTVPAAASDSVDTAVTTAVGWAKNNPGWMVGAGLLLVVLLGGGTAASNRRRAA